jgi:hypothetical protein
MILQMESKFTKGRKSKFRQIGLKNLFFSKRYDTTLIFLFWSCLLNIQNIIQVNNSQTYIRINGDCKAPPVTGWWVDAA